MSEAEKIRKRNEYLAADASVIGLADPPNVELIRWIAPEEFAPTLVDCLNEQGFNVGYTADGGVDSSGIPGEQASALELAMHVCMAQYTVDPRFLQPLNTEQRGILYDYLTGSYVSCLTDLYIQVSAPPSREVFIAAAPDQGWAPQTEVPPDQVTDANAKCPPQPSSSVLYGN